MSLLRKCLATCSQTRTMANKTANCLVSRCQLLTKLLRWSLTFRTCSASCAEPLCCPKRPHVTLARVILGFVSNKFNLQPISWNTNSLRTAHVFFLWHCKCLDFFCLSDASLYGVSRLSLPPSSLSSQKIFYFSIVFSRSAHGAWLHE